MIMLQSFDAHSQSLRHFSPNFGNIACWVAELNAVLWLVIIPERGNENIEYLISSSEKNRAHSLSQLQAHACGPAQHAFSQLKTALFVSI